MRSSTLPRAGLAACTLGFLAATAPAADLEKYLPDDAQSVVVVNVKQITSWPPFQKRAEDQLRQLLAQEPVQAVLKDTGFDPLRDVDRVVIVAAASSPQVIKPPPSGLRSTSGAAPPPLPASMTAGSPLGFPTFILIQGTFDADKLQARVKEAAKNHSGMVKARKVGDLDLWEINAPPGVAGPEAEMIYAALLDKSTLMASALESQALEALDKAAGKRKTDLKDKQVRDTLAKADPKAALQVVASGDLVTKVSMNSDGKGGYTTTNGTLHDEGVDGVRAAVTLGDADLHLEWAITAKDADTAQMMAGSMNDGVAKSLKNVQAEAEKKKELAPLVDLMKAIQISASGDTVSVRAVATPEGLEAGVKAWFTIQSVKEGPPPPPEVGPPPTPKKDK